VISLWKYHKTSTLFVLLSALFYWVFAYELERTDFPKLIGLYVALFVLAYQLRKLIGHNFKAMFLIGLGLRLLFIIAIPNLSQDFYRFIWDGQLARIGINPYLTNPNYQMDLGILTSFPNQVALFNGMGGLSASNFSNYPPLNQLCFCTGYTSSRHLHIEFSHWTTPSYYPCRYRDLICRIATTQKIATT